MRTDRLDTDSKADRPARGEETSGLPVGRQRVLASVPTTLAVALAGYQENEALSEENDRLRDRLDALEDRVADIEPERTDPTVAQD